MLRRGFTLIEAMSVVAIISVLISLGTYVTFGVQRNARDVTRKSDLTQIALAFEARYSDKTCSNGYQLYPGNAAALNTDDNLYDWSEVGRLAIAPASSDKCNRSFTDYLPRVPTPPKSTNPYKFNLNISGGIVGKNYRLAAALEKELAGNDQQRCINDSQAWKALGGREYGCEDRFSTVIGAYNYYIGK